MPTINTQRTDCVAHKTTTGADITEDFRDILLRFLLPEIESLGEITAAELRLFVQTSPDNNVSGAVHCHITPDQSGLDPDNPKWDESNGLGILQYLRTYHIGNKQSTDTYTILSSISSDAMVTFDILGNLSSGTETGILYAYDQNELDVTVLLKNDVEPDELTAFSVLQQADSEEESYISFTNRHNTTLFPYINIEYTLTNTGTIFLPRVQSAANTALYKTHTATSEITVPPTTIVSASTFHAQTTGTGEISFPAKEVLAQGALHITTKGNALAVDTELLAYYKCNTLTKVVDEQGYICPLVKNLEAYYRMINATAEQDASGNNHHASIQGGSTVDTDGRLGNALAFDGAGGILTTTDLIEDLLTTSIGYSMWFKTTGTITATQTLLGWQGDNNPTGNFAAVQIKWDTTRGIHIFIYDGINTSVRIELGTTASNLLRDGNWHHVVLSFNRETSLAYLYVNNDLVGSANVDHVGNIWFDPDRHFAVARNSRGSAPERFVGAIDEVIVNSRGFTAAEVNALYYSYTELLSILDYKSGTIEGTVNV